MSWHGLESRDVSAVMRCCAMPCSAAKKVVQRFSMLEAKVLMRVLDQDGDRAMNMDVRLCIGTLASS